jgi:hypothetical protein
LVAAFPQLREDVDEYPDLIHLQMAALRRLLDASIKDDSRALVKQIFDFVGAVARNRQNIHPDVENAIYVSFLEYLDFDATPAGRYAHSILPAVLEELRLEMADHNRTLADFAPKYGPLPR